MSITFNIIPLIHLPKYLKWFAFCKISSTPEAYPLAFLKSRNVSVSTWSNCISYQAPAEWNLQSLRLRLSSLQQPSNKFCKISVVTRFLLRLRCLPRGANMVFINHSIVSLRNDLANGWRSRLDQRELSRDRRFQVRQTSAALRRSFWERNENTSSQISSGRISMVVIAQSRPY